MATMMDAPLTVTSPANGGSRLAQMQARFQQKQMQEKEQKLLRLYESQTQRAFQRVGRGSAGSSSSSVSSTSSSLGAGKVRQLFHERRHPQARYNGWDRSHPLEPLEKLHASKSTGNLKAAATRGASLERSYQAKNHTQVRRSKSQVRSNNPTDNLSKNFRHTYDDYEDDDDDVEYRDVQNNRVPVKPVQKRFYEYDDIENEDPPFQQLDDDDDEDDYVDGYNESSRVFQKLPNVGGRLMENKANNNVDRYKTYNAGNSGTRGVKKTLGDRDDNRRMTPPAVKEAPRRREEVKPAPARSSAPVRKPESKLTTTTSPVKTQVSKPGSATKHDTGAVDSAPGWGRKTKPDSAPVQQMPPKAAPPQRSGPKGPATKTPVKAINSHIGQDLTECKICGRHFASDRIAVHQGICSKATQKKRKVFDPMKQRVKGTEAEQFLRKGKPQQVKHIKQTNWRQKHEDFINSIRAAKEMKAHIAKGGKLSDLPPPPPSDYSDYVQCPHCSRRFNQQAAERHIPKCATYQHNKPKPQAGGRGAVPKKR